MKLPDDWDRKPLAELSEYITVGIVVRPTQYYCNEGVRTFRSLNVKPGKVLDNDWVYITAEGHEKNSKSELRTGDVVVVRTGDVGVACVVPPEYNGANCIDLVVIRPNKSAIDPHFVSALINSDSAKRQIAGLQGGMAQKHLNVGAVNKLLVPLPSIGEQRRIAEILGAWDEAIEKVGDLIQAKQKLKRGLMQKLLTGKLRFPEFARTPLKKRELGEFFRHFKEKNGDADREPLSCSKVHGIVPQSQIFGKRLASADLARYQVVRRGDLVFDPMLLWDASISFVEKVEQGVISPAYSSFHVNKQKADLSFFRELLKCHRMRHWYKVISRGTNKRRRKAMPEDFLQVAVPVPELAEQQRVGALFTSINSEISRLEDLTDLLQQQKRGLMQQLLTGKKRVNVGETEAEPAAR